MKERTLIDRDYNKKRPPISFRSNLPTEIMQFIKKLKSKNQGSIWINMAIIEKYKRDNKKVNHKFN